MSRRLYVKIRGGNLRAAYVPEKVQNRPGDAAARYGSNKAKAARSRTNGKGDTVMSKKRQTAEELNVFRDIGVRNPEEHLVKAQLVYKIDNIMKKHRLKQAEAARLFGVKQPDVSKMLRGEFRQFSVERLMRFLVALDQNVAIVVTPHRDKRHAPSLHVS